MQDEQACKRGRERSGQPILGGAGKRQDPDGARAFIMGQAISEAVPNGGQVSDEPCNGRFIYTLVTPLKLAIESKAGYSSAFQLAPSQCLSSTSDVRPFGEREGITANRTLRTVLEHPHCCPNPRSDTAQGFEACKTEAEKIRKKDNTCEWHLVLGAEALRLWFGTLRVFRMRLLSNRQFSPTRRLNA